MSRAVEELDPERVVLAFEPRSADAEDRPAVRDVVEGRDDLRDEARVAERVRPDHQAEADPGRQRAERGQHAVALEQGLLPRPEDGHQVVPRPDRIPAGGIGRDGGVAEPGPVGCWPQSWSPNRVGEVVVVGGVDGGVMRSMVRDLARPAAARPAR